MIPPSAAAAKSALPSRRSRRQPSPAARSRPSGTHAERSSGLARSQSRGSPPCWKASRHAAGGAAHRRGRLRGRWPGARPGAQRRRRSGQTDRRRDHRRGGDRAPGAPSEQRDRGAGRRQEEALVPVGQRRGRHPDPRRRRVAGPPAGASRPEQRGEVERRERRREDLRRVVQVGLAEHRLSAQPGDARQRPGRVVAAQLVAQAMAGQAAARQRDEPPEVVGEREGEPARQRGAQPVIEAVGHQRVEGHADREEGPERRLGAGVGGEEAAQRDGVQRVDVGEAGQRLTWDRQAAHQRGEGEVARRRDRPRAAHQPSLPCPVVARSRGQLLTGGGQLRVGRPFAMSVVSGEPMGALGEALRGWSGG